MFPHAKILGIDPLPGPHTTHKEAKEAIAVVEKESGRLAVFHAGALHKPQVATHSEQNFVEKNITFTLELLQGLLTLKNVSLESFVYTR